MEPRLSSPSDMTCSNPLISSPGSMMAELSSVLTMRILGMGSVTRKSFVDTMRLRRLANINGGQCGREYPDSSILCVSLRLFHVNDFDSGASIGSINAVVSVEHVVQSTQQGVKVILGRLNTGF